MAVKYNAEQKLGQHVIAKLLNVDFNWSSYNYFIAYNQVAFNKPHWNCFILLQIVTPKQKNR